MSGPQENPKFFIPTVMETGYNWCLHQAGEKPLKLVAALFPELFSANLGRGNHQQAHSAKQELLDVVRDAAPLIVQIVNEHSSQYLSTSGKHGGYGARPISSIAAFFM